MAMIRCPECKKEISDLAEKCPNCGFLIGFSGGTSFNTGTNNTYQQPITVTPYVSKNKNSTLGILALVFSLLGCTFIVGVVLAIIDLCKKDGRKKGLSIAALLISFVWLVIGITASGSNNSSSNSSQSISPQINDEKEIQSNEKIEISKETEENGIDSDIAEEEEKEEISGQEKQSEDKYYVGDIWKNKYVLVSFDKCGEYISDNQFIQPNEGNKYVYATFTFENVGNSDTTVSYWDFDCYADGYACEGTYGADDAGFSQTLSSGRKITGSVYFEVPKDSAEIEFEFSPNFWTSEKIIFVYQ